MRGTWVDSLVFWIFGPPFLLCLLFAASTQRSEYNGGYFFVALIAFPIALAACALLVDTIRNRWGAPVNNSSMVWVYASLLLFLVAHVCGSLWGFTTRERVQANLIFPDKYAHVWNVWMYLRGFSVTAAIAGLLHAAYRGLFPAPSIPVPSHGKQKKDTSRLMAS